MWAYFPRSQLLTVDWWTPWSHNGGISRSRLEATIPSDTGQGLYTLGHIGALYHRSPIN